ncbi:MAG TPA: Kdo hydroxylase family protein [Thermoanaerobaculia bacterium]|nr:Kdo hydroxylase family protein [Thermoanaerobaculia bacterium]
MAVVGIETLPKDGPERDREVCRVLEEGNILLFRETPFELPERDREFLLRQRQTEAGYHKNIAYRPGGDRVTGVARQQAEDAKELRRVLRDYSRTAVDFASRLLAPYAGQWRLDYASFRPQEEAGRRLSRHARNDLLHVDSFPTRPTRGDRIFRLFTNINPRAPRVWRTGETFPELAERFAVSSGLLERVSRRGAGRSLLALLRSAGLRVRTRPPYDEFMHRFHNYLKENDAYQESARAQILSFAPGATWMVFTDMVAHSVLSGQYALEQTFLIARESLTLPERAPVAVLERLAGKSLTD